jgi:excisionase family DNA binding protein
MTAQLLTIRQAAEHFGVDPRTIRRWISAGVLPARRVGPRVIRVNPDDLGDVGRKLA